MDSVSPTPTPNTPKPTGPGLERHELPVGASPLSYRAQLIQRASAKIPYTAEGLPVGFYRADLIPHSQPESGAEELSALKTAFVDLSFEHGYPTLPDGRPFWSKLQFEPPFAYGAFQIYLEQIDHGPREISSLREHEELVQLASRMRGLPPGERISKEHLGQMINEFAALYYWRIRAKAHDLYKEAAFRHKRLRRQMTSEDRHFNLAENLLNQLQEKVFSDPEFWTHMSGKTAVDLLAKLVAIQRISVGLPATGPLSQKETPDALSFEMIMRSLGQKNAGNIYENNANQDQGRNIVDTVLSDQGAAAQLQELVIRVTKASQNSGQQEQVRGFKGRNRTVSLNQEDDLATGYDLSGSPGAPEDE